MSIPYNVLSRISKKSKNMQDLWMDALKNAELRERIYKGDASVAKEYNLSQSEFELLKVMGGRMKEVLSVRGVEELEKIMATSTGGQDGTLASTYYGPRYGRLEDIS